MKNINRAISASLDRHPSDALDALVTKLGRETSLQAVDELRQMYRNDVAGMLQRAIDSRWGTQSTTITRLAPSIDVIRQLPLDPERETTIEQEDALRAQGFQFIAKDEGTMEGLNRYNAAFSEAQDAGKEIRTTQRDGVVKLWARQ